MIVPYARHWPAPERRSADHGCPIPDIVGGEFAQCVVGSANAIGFLGLGGLLAGMLGVSAMAVQNALVQISLKGAPSTAVMTPNIMRFIMDVGDVMFGREPVEVAEARDRAIHTRPAIVGYAIDCGLETTCEAARLRSWPYLQKLALIAIAMEMTANLADGQDS
jgi:hypothetical protein